eukprot:CAMPEP_0177588784 /NCGR_PEP_ID=MMETSP0419_2-20121207/6421_1 /TAXON_ID=582737 /ORGANISM="Tetraselmis sp., Strain GSL018" /LENGTH=660 /DNA_ID=CAMNT_0019079027 /DNA_START=185 /DNA_END=2164 /DNA_ORIENTATION=+
MAVEKQLGPLLEVLCGQESIPLRSSFWGEMFTVGQKLGTCSPSSIDAIVQPYVRSLANNSSRTLALHKLLHLVAELVGGTGQSPSQAVSAVRITRSLIKAAIEGLDSVACQALLQGDAIPTLSAAPHICTPGTAVNRGSTNEGRGAVEGFNVPDAMTRSARALLSSLRRSTSGSPSPADYLLKLEAMLCLEVMMSTQLSQPRPTAAAGEHPFTEIIMQQSDLAPSIVEALLGLYIANEPVPSGCPIPSEASQEPGRSLLHRLGSAAGAVLSLPYRAASLAVRTGAPAGGEHSPLGAAALHLLLLLLYHFPAPAGPPNPFRGALGAMQDTGFPGGGEEEEGAPAVQFGALRGALAGRGPLQPAPALLLYTLLVRNKAFAEHVLVCGEPSAVLLPLLEALYEATGGGAQRPPGDAYIPLICVLVLSEDALYAAEIHRGALPAVPWYRERQLSGVSLGSLAVLVLLRAASHSLARGHRRPQDVYVAANSLGALANLAPHASGMSSHAAQRLVSVYDALRRRVARQEGGAPAAAGDEAAGELLRIVLEVLNTMLAQALPRNPELAYSLLHRQELFAPLRGHPLYGSLVRNITAVADHLNRQVDLARARDGWEWSVGRVLDAIQANLRTWRPDWLEPTPELRFSYEEGKGSAADFFVPYVWRLAA